MITLRCIAFMRTGALLVGMAAAVTAQAETLALTRTIPLSHIEGRIDHLTLDEQGHRLFVAALGNHSVEVVDLKTGNVVHSISNLSEPQGVFYVREFNRLYVTNAGDGTLNVFDGTTFSPVTVITFDKDADNIRYDSTAKLIYVGYGDGALGIVDATKNVVIGNIPLDGHPESFQLEKNGAHIFINVPTAHVIVVADRATKKPTHQWSLGTVAGNFPMALDEVIHRAFVCSRTPARLLVYDTSSGSQVAELELHGDCDDVFYDAGRHQIYASCGQGFIDVFAQTDTDHYILKEAVATVAKARTCLLDGQEIYLAVPRQGERPAAIRCYRANP